MVGHVLCVGLTDLHTKTRVVYSILEGKFHIVSDDVGDTAEGDGVEKAEAPTFHPSRWDETILAAHHLLSGALLPTARCRLFKHYALLSSKVLRKHITYSIRVEIVLSWKNAAEMKESGATRSTRVRRAVHLGEMVRFRGPRTSCWRDDNVLPGVEPGARAAHTTYDENRLANTLHVGVRKNGRAAFGGEDEDVVTPFSARPERVVRLNGVQCHTESLVQRSRCSRKIGA
mmetsp:Transcript_38612/g.83955  ORF Transcript_38612/g.83955 Transcript_38612/m.83955 type:complete len:230 (+) Transcript_38612:143-832(+)